MDPAVRSTNLRTLAIYGGVALLLIVAIILGVRWAKSRADYYSQRPSQTPTTNNQGNQGQPSAPPQPSQPSTPPANQSQPGNISGAQTNQPAPSTAATPPSVPSTGPADTFMTTVALAALAFSGIKYLQARRRLLTIR